MFEVLRFKITILFEYILQSCIFSIITPVFSVTWSSAIIAAQETILIIINAESIWAV